MSDFATGHTDRHGLELWLSVSDSTRVGAKPSQIPGDIVLTLGSGTGTGLVLTLTERIADDLVDKVVDALEAARMAASAKLQASEDANADR